MSRLFVAKFRGTCAMCGDRWEPGEVIGYVEDTLFCGPCYDTAEQQQEWEHYMEREDD